MIFFLALVQLFFSVVIGLYFLNQLRSQREGKNAKSLDSGRERGRLLKMREIHLTMPLSEKARPGRLDDVLGQQEGIRALKAALCGPNPQHVIIYGPPGIGKTCAARLVMAQAKANPDSPFAQNAPFVEVDATCLRFDERMFADPLIGSVHDPIYQGSGAMGAAGIPQPKEGAVTKAHGGILFLDEIGELPPNQLNKLLKVLEDRKVMLESVYYSPSNHNIPSYIHDIFANGLPADFRLVGATTRSPQDIPEALRSRCMEVFFRPLSARELADVAASAAARSGFEMDADCAALAAQYAGNGRDVVNLVQMAGGMAQEEGRTSITAQDIRFVLHAVGREAVEECLSAEPVPGEVHGLAVFGANMGAVIRIEAAVLPAEPGQGRLVIQGLAEQEQSSLPGRSLVRKSTALSSAENAVLVLQKVFGLPLKDYDIYINLPGGAPVDGPSAGLALLTAVYSAYCGVPVDGKTAVTGEISLTGAVLPVGGVPAKVRAALDKGFERVLVPSANAGLPEPQVTAVATAAQALELMLGGAALPSPQVQPEGVLSAQGTV